MIDLFGILPQADRLSASQISKGTCCKSGDNRFIPNIRNVTNGATKECKGLSLEVNVVYWVVCYLIRRPSVQTLGQTSLTERNMKKIFLRQLHFSRLSG